MKTFKLASFTATALAAFTSVALAGSYTPPPVVPLTPPPAAAAHDWTGWYGDVYAGRWTSGPLGNFGGGNLGYNMSNGTVIYGGEFGVFHDPSLALTNVSIAGRVGTQVGANGLGFARIGLSQDSGGGPSFYLLGLGGQYAVSNNLYLRGEYVFETPIGGGLNSASIRVGAGWEF